MVKKVLVLSASPRKGGNSDLLCDQFIAGASAAGHTAEKIFLRAHKIGYCMGCGACAQSGVCVIKDDMAAILQKMIDADVIVLATPVYFYSMNGQLKTLIDRTVARYTQIRHKDFYFIVSAADTSIDHMQKTIEALRGFTEDCLDDAHEKGIIYGVGAWQVGEIKGSPAMHQAYEMGKNV